MQCKCRNCGKEYDNQKARGEYTGFCSAKCQHAKAKELGFKKGESEYDILNRARCIGDVPTEKEQVKLREELESLEKAIYASPSRIETLKRMLKHD